MKSMVLPLSMLLLSVVSCGKKAEVNDNTPVETNIRPSTAEVYFNSLKEIKRSVTENDLPALKKAVSENPDVDLNQTMSDNGETFLIIAIKYDFRDIRNYLIEKSVSLEKANINKETPLLAAVVKNQENSVRVLLDYKVDLEKKDANGDTALHVAIKKSNDTVALLLIKHGANIETLDKKERNAFKLAQEHNVPKCLDLLKSIVQMESGAPDLGSFRTILEQADHKRLNNMLTRYPKIAVDHAYESINPLALLVDVKDEKNAFQTAELLIHYQANVNGPLDAEQTPLIKATMNEKKGFANLFLSSKANPQLQDKDGKSALIHAVELNNPEMVDLLLNYSANEKYTFRKDGKKITYSACDEARKVARLLQTEKEKDANDRIQESLDCGLLRWMF